MLFLAVDTLVETFEMPEYQTEKCVKHAFKSQIGVWIISDTSRVGKLDKYKIRCTTKFWIFKTY